MPSTASAALDAAIIDLSRGSRTAPQLSLLQEYVSRLIWRKLAPGTKNRPPGDLRSFLGERGYADEEITHPLNQEQPGGPGIPLLIHAWAAMITRCLVDGTCDCFVQHEGDNSEVVRPPRKYTAARKRCREQHRLSSLRAAAREDHRYRSRPRMFVVRAVIGFGTLQRGKYRQFGDSMFCRVFDTPDDAKLRIVRWRDPECGKGKYVLTVTNRTIPTKPRELEDIVLRDRQTAQYGHAERVMVCRTCEAIVGSPTSVAACIRDCHVWEPRSLTLENAAPGTHQPIKVSTCHLGHVWPWANTRNQRCPMCGGPRRPVRTIEVFVPRDVSYFDVG